MKKLRILIADDHPLVRHGLRSVLESQPGWTVCGEAEEGRSAVKLGLELKPDVFLMDVTMPELNGLDATRQLCRERPDAAILILTMHESDQLRADLLRAGARGCLLKSDSPRQLLAAVEAVASGKQYFIPNVTGGARPSDRTNNAGAGRLPARLSGREREIVQLLAEGRTNKEIATLLGIAYKTVDAHRTNIMKRLNMHSVAELVRYAIRERIIEP
ncbi:MAG TPA: response regulator transcription factor [Chthoniobacterales bacterium]|nr:response regulator transcription factor [Chthoniobacterales bacterium]